MHTLNRIPHPLYEKLFIADTIIGASGAAGVSIVALANVTVNTRLYVYRILHKISGVGGATGVQLTYGGAPGFTTNDTLINSHTLNGLITTAAKLYSTNTPATQPGSNLLNIGSAFNDLDLSNMPIVIPGNETLYIGANLNNSALQATIIFAEVPV